MATLSLVLVYRAEENQIRICFQNDSQYRFVLDGEVTFNGLSPIPMKATISPNSSMELGKMPFDRINDYPHFEMDIERHSGKGHEDTFESTIKTKPKHLLKMSILPDWGDRPGRRYEVWKEKAGAMGLPENVAPKTTPQSRNPTRSRPAVITNLGDLAVFSREIDLHADKLFKDPGKVSPEEIYHKQMKTFSWYIDKAHSMNIGRVFIIHGVGSGRLKNEIAKRLEYDARVASYTNEHHPKYGFGATEVEFRAG